jgi:hypothetical protein
MKRLLVIAATAALLSLMPRVQRVQAQNGGYPLGADVITEGTNYTVTSTPGTNTSASATNTVLTTALVPANVQRVRLRIIPDPVVGGFIGYGPTGTSNTIYMAGTGGLYMIPGTTNTYERPHLVKMPVTLTFTNKVLPNGVVTNTSTVIDESGFYE